jgi:hypothetical protein
MSPSMHWLMVETAFVHMPFEHVVPAVQPLPSSHGCPWFPGTPPTQLPAEHVSLTVQGLPSSQGFPSLPGTATHVFIASLHVPIMQTSFGGAHVLGCPMHEPCLHVSFTVQNCASSHGVPSFCGIAWQPRTGSHTPSEHVPLKFEQSTGGPFEHVPWLHVPEYVHGSPSSHDAPSLPGALPHDFVPSSHDPTWHASGEGQNLVEPPTHMPP